MTLATQAPTPTGALAPPHGAQSLALLAQTNRDASHEMREAAIALSYPRIPSFWICSPPNWSPAMSSRRRRWSETMYPVVKQKFAGTRVDFTEVIADFEERISPTY